MSLVAQVQKFLQEELMVSWNRTSARKPHTITQAR